jgi:hypothetical protein
MGVLEVAARIVQLGGAPERAGRVAALRAEFEARTGRFVPEDPWFEERSRAFWCDAVTTGRFGRGVENDLTEEERGWLVPLERAHRGLFRMVGRDTLVDVWSGAEFRVRLFDEQATRAELDASVDASRVHSRGGAGAAQLFDGRVVAVAGEEAPEPFCVALLPGPLFHPREATSAIDGVLRAARAKEMTTQDVLDALLRMERSLRSLARVKASYAYRPEALSPRPPGEGIPAPARRASKAHR